MASFFLILLLFTAAAPAAAAQPLRLDLGKCRRRALETAPDLASAEADVDASQLSLRVADAALLPAVRGEGGYLRSSVDRRGVQDFAANNGENEYIARAVVSQPLYTGGSLSAARGKARAEKIGAEHGLASAQAQVLLSTDRSYFAVIGADEKRTIAEGALAVTQELLKATRVRFENGEVPAFDVAKLELEVANVTTVLRTAEANAGIARAELGILIGLPAEGFVLEPLPAESNPVPNLPPLDGVVAQALVDRPDVKRLEADVRATEQAVGLARGARLPQVTAEAAGGYDSLDLPDRRNVGWQAGLAVSLPLWDWNRLANRERIARLEVEKARQRLEGVRRAVRGDVTRRYLEARLAKERVDTSGAAAVLAERNADIARRGYDLGLVSSLDLITAQHQATAARSELAGARYEQRVAVSELDFATGRLR